MRLILTLALALLASAALAAMPDYSVVKPGIALNFPRDHGAHPEFRNEWWYLTGWLDTPDGPQGFQVTFFRTRPAVDDANPSAFAPKQILFAHAALSDPKLGRLLHAEHAARAGFGLAEASTADTDIVLDTWRLTRGADGRFHAVTQGKDFSLDLSFTPSQPILLEGDAGYSRKGPQPEEASYYYSLPQLRISGHVQRGNRNIPVTGTAWLDREWSSTLLPPEAVGWDWVGLNLNNGGALMAFQIRDAAGKAIWAGGTLRDAGGAVTHFAPESIHFAPTQHWRSPRTGALYPVAQTLTVSFRDRDDIIALQPIFTDQELDSRPIGGPVYWEGAVKTELGQGYLELTGYAQALRF